MLSKNGFKKLINLVMALIFAALIFSGCEGERVYDIPDYSESDGVIDILAWHAPPYHVNHIPEQFTYVIEAGYTMAVPGGEVDIDWYPDKVDKVLGYLDMAADAGLKVFVHDAEICRSDTFSNTNAYLYKDHPAVYGIFLGDEPAEHKWPLLKDKIDACIEEFGTEKLLYLNNGVVTQYPIDFQFDRLFTAVPNLQMLSYDNYCMMSDGSVRSSFINEMAVTRYFAKRNNVISGFFILTNGGYWDYRVCSEEDIRWQSMLLMTYGYDIISHFCYIEFDDNDSMIDADGNRRPIYYTVQKINNELHSWEKVYKSFGWQGTAVIESEEDPEQLCENVLMGFKEEEIAGVNKITSSQNILCGIFKDDKQNMGYVLTSGINPGRNKKTDVSVEFDKAYKGALIMDKDYAVNGWKVVNLDRNNRLNIKINAGEGVFVIPLKLA